MAPFTPPTSDVSRGAAPPRGAAPRARWKRLFLAASLFALGFWGWNWLSVDETGQPVTQTSDEPQAEIEGLQSFLVRGEGGQTLWEFSARRVTIAADGTSTLLAGISRALLYRDGKPFLKMSAPRVRFANLSNDIEASGGISATGPNEFSFQTSRALWFNARQVVECPKPTTAWLRDVYFQTPRLFYNWSQGTLKCPQSVEVRTQGAVLRGNGLEANLKTRQIQLSGGVRLTFAPQAVQRALAPPK